MYPSQNTYRQNVLIVEDDAFIALDIECVLESAGFEVAGTMSQVDEALKFLEDDVPDLALLDYNLGDENSVPVAKRLGELNVPFMFVSGQTRDVVLKELEDEHLVLSKPFRPAQLVGHARELVSA